MAPAGHSKSARDNLIVYVSCELLSGVQDRPFLAFSKQELQLLRALGTFDLHHACVCVFGCSGKLRLNGSDAAVVGPGLDLQVGTAWLFEPDVPQPVWQDTLIPFTETHLAGSVATSTSSSSASSLATIDKITLPEQVAAASGLQISVNGIQHLLDFDTQALTTRQSNLHQLLGQPEMDAGCCITGKPTAEAAHLVKMSNPDVVRLCFHPIQNASRSMTEQISVHILASRSSLYPEIADMFDAFEGSYDPRLALFLNSSLRQALEENDIYLDKVDDAFVVGSTTTEGELELINTFTWITQDSDAPPRRAERHFKVEREPSTLQPAKVFVDWCFGSRVLAKFGTPDAIAISKRGAITRAVSMWREKVKEAKASRKRKVYD